MGLDDVTIRSGGVGRTILCLEGGNCGALFEQLRLLWLDCMDMKLERLLPKPYTPPLVQRTSSLMRPLENATNCGSFGKGRLANGLSYSNGYVVTDLIESVVVSLSFPMQHLGVLKMRVEGDKLIR